MALFGKKNKHNDFLDAYKNKYGTSSGDTGLNDKFQDLVEKAVDIGVKKVEQGVDALNAKVDDYNKRVETANTKDADFKPAEPAAPTFKNKKQEIEYLKSRVSRLEADKASLEAHNDELSALISDEAKSMISLEDSLKEKVTVLTDKINELNYTVEEKKSEVASLKAEIKEKYSKILQLDDEILYQDFGLYEPKYNCVNSEEYKEKIKAVRQQQKDMIKEKTALITGVLGSIYGAWLIYAAGLKYLVMASILFAIGILVFDKGVHAKASPMLCIDENDVKAFHGASEGQINKDHIFYLMSRGVSETEAKKLITYGYLYPIIQTFTEEDIKNAIVDCITKRV